MSNNTLRSPAYGKGLVDGGPLVLAHLPQVPDVVHPPQEVLGLGRGLAADDLAAAGRERSWRRSTPLVPAGTGSRWLNVSSGEA